MASIDELKAWLKVMSERGVYGGAAARVRATAVEQLSSVLGSDEPKDPAWLLANIDAVANRWATKHHATPETTSTYRSRAKSTLTEFLEYTRDPSKFRGPRSRKSPKNETPKAPPRPPAVPLRDDGGTHVGTGSGLNAEDNQVQSFVFTLSAGPGRLTVPFPLTPLDIRLIKKQVELLELQIEMTD